MWGKLLPCHIVKVIAGGKEHFVIVGLPEVLYAIGLCIGMVLTCHMVWHKVDNHFKPGLMRALHKCLKLGHTLRHIDSQIRVDVVIITDSIGATGLAFHDMRILAPYSERGIVGVVGMLYHAGIPYVRGSQILYSPKNSRINVVELS